MTYRKSTALVGGFLIASGLVAGGGANAAFVAYNDLASAAADTGSNLINVTTYGPRGKTNADSVGGQLVNYASGTSTGVTLVISETTGGSEYAFEDVAPTSAFTGGTAKAVFGDIVDTRGAVNYNGSSIANGVGGSITLTFNGLSSDQQYEIVLAGNRNTGTDDARKTRYLIGGADAFTNTSSNVAGASVYGTTSTSNDTVTINNGSNLAAGYVARWESINAGVDGSFSVTVSGTPGGNQQWYVNAFRLTETAAVPEPTSAAVVGLAGMFLAARRRRA